MSANCFKKHVRKKLAEPVAWQLSCPGCYGQQAHNYGAEELESLVDRGYMDRDDKIEFLDRESTAKTNAMLGKEGLPRCRRLVDSGNGRQKVCNAHIEETPDAYAFCTRCCASITATIRRKTLSHPDTFSGSRRMHNRKFFKAAFPCPSNSNCASPNNSNASKCSAFSRTEFTVVAGKRQWTSERNAIGCMHARLKRASVGRKGILECICLPEDAHHT